MIYVLASLLGLLCGAAIIYVVWTWPAPRSPENATERPLPTMWRVLPWVVVYQPGDPPFDWNDWSDAALDRAFLAVPPVGVRRGGIDYVLTAEDYWREHTGRQS